MQTRINKVHKENLTDELHQILEYNESIYQVLIKIEHLFSVPYYIGAGCIAQTVWNYQNGNELMYGIEDLDVVYFDESDLSYNAENEMIELIKRETGGLDIRIDVKNQARVHLWYQQHFGYEVEPYNSLEQAIDTWPTTASAVGVRLEYGKLRVYAPFGLEDMFNQVIVANKIRITKEIYENKTIKWSKKWNTLKIVPWE